MKVVINVCFGGYGLSPLAIAKIAELNGKKCYAFEGGLSRPYKPVTLNTNNLFVTCFDSPKPKDDNKWYSRHILDAPEDRSNAQLIQVVEELGEKANGRCADLKVVEIPDGVDYDISEYDGLEHIAEKHRTWQ